MLALCLLLVLNSGCTRDAQDSTGPGVDDDDDDDQQPGEPLYAAAGRAVISPDPRNHPEQIYLGGIYPSRMGTGVHDELLASALMLQQGDNQVVLVSLDLLGFTRTRAREIQQRLEGQGIEPEHVLIASTHTHEAPDTMGVFGPDVLHSGVSPAYMRFIQDSVVDLVLSLREQLVPVNMRAVKVDVNDPLSNYPTLIADSRHPYITVPWLTAAGFDDTEGNTVATLVNWHSHPEVMIESTLVSSDFPKWVRDRVRDKTGGECVYISGALGGLSSPTGVDVAARDENGDPVMDGSGDPLYLQDGTWDKARSLGYVIADLALDDLDAAEPLEDPHLNVAVWQMPLPVENIIMIAAYFLGILEFDDLGLITDNPDFCGWLGCMDDRLGFVRLGPLALITSPGETFPETFIGRPESILDFGEPWGPTAFPAIRGLTEFMNAEVPMHMSVCGNEIGYLIPEPDFHPRGHPDYYEEDLFLGYDTETIYYNTAIEIMASVPAAR